MTANTAPNDKSPDYGPRHAEARRLAQAGIPIFPCVVNGKAPACAHSFKDATTDLDEIDRWWGEADYNIGMCPEDAGRAACGKPWCVVDPDLYKEGAEWLDLVAKHGEPLCNLTQATPRGGKHLVFEGSLPPTSNAIGKHIDTRGQRSYILLAPSVVDGKEYRVTSKVDFVDVGVAGDLLPVPQWIVEKIGQRRREASTSDASQSEFDCEQRKRPGEPRLPLTAEQIERALSEEKANKYPGRRSDAAAAFIKRLQRANWSAEEVVEIMMAHEGAHVMAHYGEPADEDRVRDDVRRLFPKPTTHQQSTSQEAFGKAIGAVAVAWPQPDLVISEKTGKPIPTYKNARIAAESLPGLAFDTFNQVAVYCGPTPWSDRPEHRIDDPFIRVMRDAFIAQWNLEVPEDHVVKAVLAAAEKRPFHPVRDYLDGLQWDSKPRLDTWLIDYLGAANTPFNRAAGRKTLLGAVARVYQPGRKFDTVLVIEGVQGLGKSSAVAILAIKPEWFLDGLSADLSSKDAAHNLQGKWIVENGELAGTSRAQVETIKAFMSRAVDHFRPSYARLPQDFPRQCIVISTCNETSYLRDLTGARRFWPVWCSEIDLNGLKTAVDQLYAEAVVAFRNGESLTLPRELWAAAREAQEARQNVDPWEDHLRSYLDQDRPKGDLHWSEGGRITRVHSADLLSRALDIPRGQQTQRDTSRLKAIMVNRLGWKYKPVLRVGVNLTAGYERPV